MKTHVLLTLLLSLALVGCAPTTGADQSAKPPVNSDNLVTATFAGGCFWCMEPPFDKLKGVASTTSGYIDGHVDNPTYRQVASGGTGHTEAVQVLYDPEQISYQELLYVFWRNIDPLAVDRQFCDGGDQYRTGVYAHDEDQLRQAEESKEEIVSSGRFKGPIATEIKLATKFYVAEEYHQDYYTKNPFRYKTYRTGCGRDRRLKELWGDESGGL